MLVKRRKMDRPAAVDPKAFFEPGRSDWTLEEQRYAYGDAWRIALPDGAGDASHTIDQLDLAAAVFTRANASDGVLELTATVHADPPVKVTLVDEEGKLVGGASVKRQLKRYNGKDLPETISVYGLHPQRAEFLVFTHEQRGLIGTLSTKWTSQPVRLVMKPAARLIGRITDAEGKPDFDFAIRMLGLGVMPDTYLTGEFRLVVPAGVEARGEFVRKRPDLETRPSVRAAFGPLSPMGETVNLGNLTVP